MKGQAGHPPEEKLQPNEPRLPIPAGDAPMFIGPHAKFLADETPLQCFEGARFSGKTWAACAKVVTYCVKNPGMIWLVCRYSKDDALKFMKPVFERVCNRMGHFPVWGDEAFLFSNGSIVNIGGLRSQEKLSAKSKVRGRDVGGLFCDQTEELPADIGLELPFATRQPGVPHILIITPNPPDEDSWIADFWPEDNSVPGRSYRRVSLYDNPHCPEDKLAELERLYPPTHAKFKKLILGLRGPDVSGNTIYEDAFERELHVKPVLFDRNQPLLEAFHLGTHNPAWMCAQRNYFGGFEIIGGIMGKRLFIEDFLPIVQQHREEWCPEVRQLKTCTDPPPSTHHAAMTNIKLLQEARLRPQWMDNANAPDVRESVIQSIASLMRRRLGKKQALTISDDPKHWLMASSIVIKQHSFFINGCEASYAWDANFVSVGSKKTRQPVMNEWVEGAQRCLENIVLNFGLAPSRDKLDARAREQRNGDQGGMDTLSQSKYGWMA